MTDSDSGGVSATADDKARLAPWRDHLKVHPAADLLPMMSETEFLALKDDIEKNGLRTSIVLYQGQLLDGRHRLDALEQLGLLWADKGRVEWFDFRDDRDCHILFEDRTGKELRGPCELVLSLNLHRRHLTDEQRRELIAKVIKAKPEASDRAIAKQVERDHKTVAKVRRKLESTGEVSPVQKRVGADGKQRKSRAPRPKVVAPPPKPVEHRVTESAEASVEQRRVETAALDQPHETAVDEVDRRVSCVANTIRRHVDGLSYSDVERFFATLRDCVDVLGLALRAEVA